MAKGWRDKLSEDLDWTFPPKPESESEGGRQGIPEKEENGPECGGKGILAETSRPEATPAGQPQAASDSGSGPGSWEGTARLSVARPLTAGLASFIHYSEQCWLTSLGSSLHGSGQAAQPSPALLPSHLLGLLCDPDLPCRPFLESSPSLFPF